MDLGGLAHEWSELIDQFIDELGRPPSNAELAEVLTWAFRSLSEQDVDAFPSDVTIEADGGRSSGVSTAKSAAGEHAAQITSAVGQLNDSVFVTGADMASVALAELATSGGRPSVQAILNLLSDALMQARASKLVELTDDRAGNWKIRGVNRDA